MDLRWPRVILRNWIQDFGGFELQFLLFGHANLRDRTPHGKGNTATALRDTAEDESCGGSLGSGELIEETMILGS